MIAVSDWDRSNAWYCAVLGAELVELPLGRCAYRFGDQQLNVHGPGATPFPRSAEPVGPGNSDICFVWPGSIGEALEHLERHEVPVEEGPVPRTGGRGMGTSIYVRDPDGTLVELISYAERASPP